MAVTGGMPGGSGSKSCLGIGIGMRSSGLHSTALENEGLIRTTSFFIWLNCCSCERGSRSAMPIKGSSGIGTGFSLSILSPSSSSLLAGVVRGGGLYTRGFSGLGGFVGAFRARRGSEGVGDREDEALASGA